MQKPQARSHPCDEHHDLLDTVYIYTCYILLDKIIIFNIYDIDDIMVYCILWIDMGDLWYIYIFSYNFTDQLYQRIYAV